MQNLLNATRSEDRAINFVLQALEREQERETQPCCSSSWLATELAAGARFESLAWLALAVAGLAGLVISLWL